MGSLAAIPVQRFRVHIKEGSGITTQDEGIVRESVKLRQIDGRQGIGEFGHGGRP
jgi:hypothetical protein